jgi:hypothetical protein
VSGRMLCAALRSRARPSRGCGGAGGRRRRIAQQVLCYTRHASHVTRHTSHVAGLTAHPNGVGVGGCGDGANGVFFVDANFSCR